MSSLAGAARLFVAVGPAAFGVHQLAYGSLVRWIAKLPPWIPFPVAWPYLTGVAFLLGAAALMAPNTVARLPPLWA